jgi:hypothetical protein
MFSSSLYPGTGWILDMRPPEEPDFSARNFSFSFSLSE